MEKRWYAVRTYAGHERNVKTALERRIRESGKEDLFGGIVVPTETVIDLIRGKRKAVEKRILPGYVFLQMADSAAGRALIHSIARVLSIIGEPGEPAPLRDDEVKAILDRMEATRAAPRPKAPLFVGERVKIVDGPFRDFSGHVADVKPERSRVRVLVSVFGRPTPVDLDVGQVQAA